MSGLTRNLRELLRAAPNGMSTVDLCTTLCRDPTDVAKRRRLLRALRAMPDAYIDRWTEGARKAYTAVWCIVTPPPHCPHPTGKYGYK